MRAGWVPGTPGTRSPGPPLGFNIAFAPTIGASFIEELSRKLRKACGCGGTVREREIEIQGDQPDKIRALLENEGFRVAGIR